MKFTIGSRFSLYTSIFVTITITLFLSWSAAKTWLSYVYATDPPPNGLNDAIRIESENSQFYFMLGEYYANYDLSAPRSRVYDLYKKALELNPLDYNYWYYLAEFLLQERKRDLAIYTLNKATELAPGVVSLRWAAGMLASRLGDEEALINNLRAVIAYDRHRRYKAFPILWQSLRNGDKVREAVPYNALPTYLHFLISTKRVSEAKAAWEKLSSMGEIPEDIFLRYVSFLISEKELPTAINVWTDRLGKWEGIWNGDFNEKILNAGFDWKLGNVEGAKIIESVDTNDTGRSIKIAFDGNHNVDFYHLRQLIPVEEETNYKLTSLMKSKDISTRNGLSWQVYCANNKNLHAESEQVRGTTDWHPVTVSFTTPKNCSAVVLKLRRYKTDKFSNNFSGILWVDKVSLEKVQ